MCNKSSVAPSISLTRLISITFIIALIATLPVWTHKIYYQDDYSRLLSGDGSYWINNGRPVAWFINVLLRFSPVINDLSPLPLILGLMALSVTSNIYVEKLNLSLKGYWALIPAQFMLLNPYLAQGMLYTFDSMSILLASALGLLASLPLQCSRVKHILGVSTLLLLSLTNYQPGVNVYIGCTALMMLSLRVRQVSIRSFIINKGAALIIAMLIYKFAIVSLIVTDPYNIMHSLMINGGSGSIGVLMHNFSGFYALIMSAFPGNRRLLVIVPLLITCAGLLKLTAMTIGPTQGKSKKLYAIGCILAASLIIISSPIGLSALLITPIVAPRVLTAWSVLMLFCFYISTQAFPLLRYWMASVYLLPLIYSLVTMVSIFNTVINQERYSTGVLLMMKADLAHIVPQGIRQIAFIGKLGDSPDVKANIRNFPLYTSFDNPMLSDSFSWKFNTVGRRENILLPLIKTPPEIIAFIPKRYLSQNCDYRLFVYQSTAVFDFTTQDCGLPE